MAMGGTIVEIAKGYIDGQLDEIAHNIYMDMNAAISKHNRSGAAIQALMIESMPYSRFIGAYVGSDPHDGGLHIKWLNDGNRGNMGALLRPTRSKALNTPYGLKANVRSHGGEHFIEAIASKYR